MCELAKWAMEFLQPVRAAEAALTEARQAVKSHEEECKRRLQGAHDQKGHESRLVELQSAVAAQLEDRAKVVQDPLWLILQHLTQHNFVKRRVHQKEALAKMQAGQEVQRLRCDETAGAEQAGPSFKRPRQ
jgi:hypothetical protein